MPTLNLVQRRKKRSIEKYEDDDINNQEEEQKYLIDDDEILMNNRLSKRSQMKKYKKDAINKLEANKRKQANNENLDENEEISKFFFPEPIKFLDSATPEDTKNELLIEKSLFDEKNYFENIENVSSKLKKTNETKSKATNLTRKSNDSANKSRYKKMRKISIQTNYQKLSNNSETANMLQKVTSEPRHNSTIKLKSKNSTHFESNTTERVHESTNTQQNYRHAQIHEISNLDTKSNPSVDWSMMIPNDSEKTIYESFYELLDTDKRDFNDAEAQNNSVEDKAEGYFKSNDQT